MNITFANRSLRKLANNDRRSLAELGRKRFDKLRRRLVDLSEAESLEALRYLPGNYHELKGERKGQWACDLDQPYRLVFTPHEDPVPKDMHGRYIWLEIHGIEVLEIIDYH